MSTSRAIKSSFLGMNATSSVSRTGNTIDARRVVADSTVRDPSPKGRRKTMDERIRHFTPSWFAVCMGTGAVSQIMHNFPYGSPHVLQFAALAFLMLDTVLFVFFTLMTIARYIKYPKIWNLMVRHPVQSMFVGCVPMALATLINGAVNVNQGLHVGGSTFLYIIWSAWWLDQVLSFMSCFGMLYYMITRQEHSVDMMLATWLLPVVPLVVSATSGALLSQALIEESPEHALVCISVSAISVMIGLTLSFMLITCYLLRLIVYKLPPKGFIVSQFLPLGPLGQGGTAFILINQVISELSSASRLPPPFFSDPLAGTIIKFIGMSLALFLWANGLLWLFLGLISIVEVFARNKVPFGVPFWGMTFPLGVYILLTLQLALTLDSTFFRICGTVGACGLLLLWGGIALRTARLTIEGSMFHAPCLDDAPLNTGPLPPGDPGNGID